MSQAADDLITTLLEFDREEIVRDQTHSMFSPHEGHGLAGGTAPMVAVALIGATGNDMAPAWYLMFASAIAAGAAFLMADRSRKPLR